MLRVCFFFAEHFDEALAAVKTVFDQVETVNTSGDDGAYWNCLSQIWDAPDSRDLLVVEQDIVVHPGVAEQLARCPRPWCEFPHRQRGGGPNDLTWKGLGCDRYSAELRRRVRSADIIKRAKDDHAPDSNWYDRDHLFWNAIDGPLFRALESAGYECHRHGPPVGHLNC